MDNENKKSRFNAIDGVIILLALLCLVAIAYKVITFNDNTINADLKEYRVHFKVDSISSSAYDYFVKGDTMRIKSTNRVFGTLEGINQHLPAVGAYNENGGKVLYPTVDKLTIYNDTRYSLSGYVTVRGEMTEYGFLLNGDTYISSNSTLDIISEHIETTIRIIDIIEK